MMGQLPASQNALFYDFCLEKHIPEDHLLRQSDMVALVSIHSGLGVSDSTKKPNIHTRLISVAKHCLTGGVHIRIGHQNMA